MLFRSSLRSPIGKVSAVILLTVELVLVIFIGGFGSTPSATGQPVTVAPRIGFSLARDRTLRPLFGLPANLVLGGAIWRGATQAAFSSTAGLVRLRDSVLLQAVDAATLGTFALDEPAPVLGVGPASANTQAAQAGHAAIWLPSGNALAMWTGEGFTVTDVDPLPGVVVSLLPTGTQSADLMVQVPGGGVHLVAVSLSNGQLVSDIQIDAQATSAHVQNGFTLLATAAGLAVVAQNGVRHTLAGIPAAVRFAPVSDAWVQVESVSGARAWLVRLDRNAPAARTLDASEIPEPRIQRPHRVAI